MDGSVFTKIRERAAPRMVGILGRRGAMRASGCGVRENRMGNGEVAPVCIAEGGSTLHAGRRCHAYANMAWSPRTNTLQIQVPADGWPRGWQKISTVGSKGRLVNLRKTYPPIIALLAEEYSVHHALARLAAPW